jgi:hypothetical protein
MNAAIRWWLGGRWKAELAFAILLIGAVVYEAGGYGRVSPGSFSIVFFFVSTLATGLEFDPAGGWSATKRPDRPTGRVALAGAVWALAPAGLTLVMVSMAAQLGEHDGFITAIGLAMVLLMPAFSIVGVACVPRPAKWVHRFNEEHKAKIVKTERDLALARTQVLQPHFLFNALNTVSALLRDDPARGRDVLLKLRALLERSWRSSDNPSTTVAEELAFVQDQLAIEQERFRDRLTVDFSVAPATAAMTIPAFSLQPLVENALRHGIARSIDGGRIAVSIRAGQGRLVMIVSDSSGGLDPHWQEGTGLRNLRDRLEATYGDAATLDLRDEGGVTLARVSLPCVLPGTPPSVGAEGE